MKIFKAELKPIYLHNLDLASKYKANDHIITLEMNIQFTLLDLSWVDTYLLNVENKASNIITYKIGVNEIDKTVINYLYKQKYFTPMIKSDFSDYFSLDSENEWNVYDAQRNIFTLKRKMYFSLGDFLKDKMTNRNSMKTMIKRSMAHKYQLRFVANGLKNNFPLVLYSADFHRDFEALVAKVALALLYDNRKIKARVKDEHLLIDRSLKFEAVVDSRKTVLKFYVKSPLKFFLRNLTGFDFGKDYNYELGHVNKSKESQFLDSKFLTGKFKI